MTTRTSCRISPRERLRGNAEESPTITSVKKIPIENTWAEL